MSVALELRDPHEPASESIWRTLEAEARPGYFGTWAWNANWLAMLPRDHAVDLAIARRGGAVCAAFFVGRRRVVRHGVIASRGRFVNATGEPRFDELCAEHNGPLLAAGAALQLDEVVSALPRDWDELVVPRMTRGAFGPLVVPPAYRVRVDRVVPAPFVDLEQVRRLGYPACLSANTRAQLRRAQRRAGATELEVAETLPAARAIFDELVELHAITWRARGEAGAFADPWFTAVHRRLIETRLASGEIQLVRLRAGGRTLGCLYNLVANGRVLFYQSGLAAFADPVLKPGYLCHAAAIELCARAGHASYDFLGGDGRYKASLATGAQTLEWVRVQRRRLRFAIEDRLRDLQAVMT